MLILLIIRSAHGIQTETTHSIFALLSFIQRQSFFFAEWLMNAMNQFDEADWTIKPIPQTGIPKFKFDSASKQDEIHSESKSGSIKQIKKNWNSRELNWSFD